VHPKKLAHLLETTALVPKILVDQVLVKLQPDETLGDRLVADGHVREADLLHTIAEGLGVRFVTASRLRDVQVPSEVLACIPLELCERHDTLPLAWNREEETLAVVMADPGEKDLLQREAGMKALERLVVHVALPGPIRGAIARLYRHERPVEATVASEPEETCSLCGTPHEHDQLECGQCGLLLNAHAPLDSAESRIVRALLSEPTSRHRVPSLRSLHDGVTRVGFRVEVSDELVPELTGGLALVGSLSEFEAFVVSYVDGATSVGDLAQATGLQDTEVRSVLASLSERRLLRLSAPDQLTPLATPAVEPEPEPEDDRSAATSKTSRRGHSAVVRPKPPRAGEATVRRTGPGPSGSPDANASSVSAGFDILEDDPEEVASVGETGPSAPLTPTVRKLPKVIAAQRASSNAAEVPTQRRLPKVPDAPSPGATHRDEEALPVLPRTSGAEAEQAASLQSALLLERNGDVDGAIRVLRSAIASAPRPAPLYNRLALILLSKKRDTTQAEELLEKARELDPDNPVYAQNLRKVLLLVPAVTER
jgi:hypothetical protein